MKFFSRLSILTPKRLGIAVALLPASVQPAFAQFAIPDYAGAHWLSLADVNGDGREDIVGFFVNGVRVSLSTGTAFTAPEWWWAGGFAASSGWTNPLRYPRLVGDVTGDGRADLVGFAEGEVIVVPSTGTSFANPTSWLVSLSATNGGFIDYYSYPRVLGDVNGDGLDDIVAFGETATMVAFSNGSSFAYPAEWLQTLTRSRGGWTTQAVFPRTVADVNGDGFEDVVGFGQSETIVALSNGRDRFQAVQPWIRSFALDQGWNSADEYPRTAADVDGDGVADAVGFGQNEVSAAISSRSSFGPATTWIRSYVPGAGGYFSQAVFPRLVGDVTGDGRADIVGFGEKEISVAVSTGSAFASAGAWYRSTTSHHLCGWFHESVAAPTCPGLMPTDDHDECSFFDCVLDFGRDAARGFAGVTEALFGVVHELQGQVLYTAYSVVGTVAGDEVQHVVQLITDPLVRNNSKEVSLLIGTARWVQGDDPLELLSAPLAGAIRTAHKQYSGEARPIPSDVKAQLAPYYDQALLDRARYTVSDRLRLTVPSLALASKPDFMGGAHDAIVVDDVIVFKSRASLSDIRLWVHEVYHVEQYRNHGIEGFAFRYAKDWGDTIEAEAEAKAAQYRSR